jgi:hypothetical protein
MGKITHLSTSTVANNHELSTNLCVGVDNERERGSVSPREAQWIQKWTTAQWRSITIIIIPWKFETVVERARKGKTTEVSKQFAS